MKPIVLASTSPRRKELLEKLGLEFEIVASDFDESRDQETSPGPPGDLAAKLSQGKAENVAPLYPDRVVIAADTLVVCDGEILGKPHTGAEAARMLRKISGRAVSVVTGFTVVETVTNRKISRSTETIVHIKTLSDDEIKSYVKTGEPLDKAGAFAIQGLGSVLVEKIEGDFFNVVGLPLFNLAEALKEFGINVLTCRPYKKIP